LKENLLEELKVKNKKIWQRGWFNRSKTQRILDVGYSMADNIKRALEEISKTNTALG